MSDRPQHEIPYLHVRPPRRVVGVGGEGDPLAEIVGNRAGLLQLRGQIDAALRADEGMASVGYGYREADRSMQTRPTIAHRRAAARTGRNLESPRISPAGGKVLEVACFPSHTFGPTG